MAGYYMPYQEKSDFRPGPPLIFGTLESEVSMCCLLAKFKTEIDYAKRVLWG